MLTLRRLVLLEDGLFRSTPDQLETLNYYASAIAHLGGADTGKANPVPANPANT